MDYNGHQTRRREYLVRGVCVQNQYPLGGAVEAHAQALINRKARHQMTIGVRIRGHVSTFQELALPLTS